ncbi:unnamed protein product [Cunninghamella echinulata]
MNKSATPPKMVRVLLDYIPKRSDELLDGIFLSIVFHISFVLTFILYIILTKPNIPNAMLNKDIYGEQINIIHETIYEDHLLRDHVRIHKAEQIRSTYLGGKLGIV